MKHAKIPLLILTLLFTMISCTTPSDSSEVMLTVSPSSVYPINTASESETTIYVPDADHTMATVLKNVSGSDIRYILSFPAVFSVLEVLNIPCEPYQICGFTSNQQHVVISSTVGEYQKIDSLRLSYADIPNATMLTVGDGITRMSFLEASSKFSNIRILTLPNTLEQIGGNFGGDFHNTFPLEFSMLEWIEVEPSNEHYADDDGILYQMQPHYIYEKNQILVAIPQNYTSDTQEVHLLEDTEEIMNCAIYHCRNIQKVVIPDSVVKIGDRAIVATAEHPLTVVCSRGSAAAAYVERFGEQYHLTVEYTD